MPWPSPSPLHMPPPPLQLPSPPPPKLSPSPPPPSPPPSPPPPPFLMGDSRFRPAGRASGVGAGAGMFEITAALSGRSRVAASSYWSAVVFVTMLLNYLLTSACGNTSCASLVSVSSSPRRCHPPPLPPPSPTVSLHPTRWHKRSCPCRPHHLLRQISTAKAHQAQGGFAVEAQAEASAHR